MGAVTQAFSTRTQHFLVHQRRMVSSHVAMLQRFVRAPGERFPWTQVSLVDGDACARAALS